MKLAALACAALLLADRPAEACSCAPPPPPCQAYSRVPAVFIGEATSVTTGQDFVVTTTFTIEELFKGPLTTGTITLLGGGMCSATFERGQKYFVYAFESGGIWHASLCGRTRRLDRATEDLAHARNLPQRQLAELLGTVRLADEQDRLTPRAGATVAVQGTSYSTKTDASGRYTLQVPPGKHTLEVIDPGTLMARGPQTVTVPDASACASEDFYLSFDGQIHGRIVDHAGRPAANVTIGTRSTAPLAASSRSSDVSAVTDASGEYVLRGVQAGKHLVVVNPPDHGGPDPGSPIPTTYYPGVASAAAARRIAMARSGLVTSIDFALPRPLPIYTVSGVVRQRGAQGQPVPAARVWLSTELPTRDHRLTNVDTDALGRFSFHEIAGARIALEVCPPGGGPNDPTCRSIRRTLTRDWTIDLEYPAAPP